MRLGEQYFSPAREHHPPFTLPAISFWDSSLTTRPKWQSPLKNSPYRKRDPPQLHGGPPLTNMY